MRSSLSQQPTTPLQSKAQWDTQVQKIADPLDQRSGSPQFRLPHWDCNRLFGYSRI